MVTLEDIRHASDVIRPYVHRTPLVASHALSERLGRTVRLKLEMLQRTGSFKPRGTFNQLLAIPDQKRERGVVGMSGGNFAQALAYGATTLGVPSVVFMPEFTPANYVDATRGYGATVELVPDLSATEAGVAEYEAEGWAATHPFDNPAMIAGNGSLGLEVVEEVPDVTDVIVSIGGGGFISGVATAIKESRPEARVWGVETEGADAMSLALQAGSVINIEPTSLSKTLGAPYVSELTLSHTEKYVESVSVVSDSAAHEALCFILERTKLLTELAASCTLAAAEELDDRLGHSVVLVLCGGNVSVDDLARYRQLFGESADG